MINSTAIKEIIIKYKYIIALFIFSVVSQILMDGFESETLFGKILFQLAASCLIGYVATQFHLYYDSKASHIKWWTSIYTFMVVASVIVHIIFEPF